MTASGSRGSSARRRERRWAGHSSSRDGLLMSARAGARRPPCWRSTSAGSQNVEADVHAFNLVMEDQARTRAAEIDRMVAAGEDPGPLAGVPVALKDLLCTRGVPTTCSSKILAGWLPPYDATVVGRLAAAGADFHRQDEYGRVRNGLFNRTFRFWPDPQPSST